MEKNATQNGGKLIFLGLPIGNLGDCTQRLIESLKYGKNFAVEDTRSFLDFLQKLEISKEGKQITSWHDQSESGRSEWISTRLQQGETVYFASEAGSPSVSDPGYDLVSILRSSKLDFDLDSYPGPTSVIHALELSELPPIPFHFHGFFPRQNSGKENLTREIGRVPGTHVFFESPHRIVSSVNWIFEHWNREYVVVVRELTKKFQSVYKLKQFEKAEELENIDRGELVILYHVGGETNEEKYFSSKELKTWADDFFQSKKDKKSLAQLLAKLTADNPKECYRKLVMPSEE